MDPLIARIDAAQKVPFGPLAFYQALADRPDLPVFTGVQTSQPGYATPLHSHPYVEVLFILEGACRAWFEGEEASPIRLGPGDLLAIPAGRVHAFGTDGEAPMRLLGIHCNPERVVQLAGGAVETGAGAGYLK